MSSEKKMEFTKETLDSYLKEVAKEYRKLNGKSMPAEMILIGGAAVLINYGFRDMTTDVDAIIQASSSMKDAINRVGDRNHLPNGWLNQDFTLTGSYSPKLQQYSKYYKTFSNVLAIRTVESEYLIAMKLRSGRKYKNDLSDVVGILSEHKKMGNPISLDQIQIAVQNLYGDWAEIPAFSRSFIETVLHSDKLDTLYVETRKLELETRANLIRFEQKYPGVANGSNIEMIVAGIQKNRPAPQIDPAKIEDVCHRLYKETAYGQENEECELDE